MEAGVGPHTPSRVRGTGERERGAVTRHILAMGSGNTLSRV